MGVRRTDLTTDVVEYDSSKDEGHDILPPHEYIEREEPRLEEIRPEVEWRRLPENTPKVTLDEETMDKLREIMERFKQEKREEDQ